MEAAKKRQRYVLNRMVADGYLTSSSARKAYDRSVKLAGGKQKRQGENGYFVQLVRKQAEKILDTSLNRAGVRIYTTIDTGLQQKTVKVFTSGNFQKIFPVIRRYKVLQL